MIVNTTSKKKLWTILVLILNNNKKKIIINCCLIKKIVLSIKKIVGCCFRIVDFYQGFFITPLSFFIVILDFYYQHDSSFVFISDFHHQFLLQVLWIWKSIFYSHSQRFPGASNSTSKAAGLQVVVQHTALAQLFVWITHQLAHFKLSKKTKISKHLFNQQPSH